MRLERPDRLGPEQLATVRDLYEDAFPPASRSDFQELLADRVLVLVDGRVPVGLAVLRDLADTGWTFLRYFAVGVRGHGLGQRFWQLLRAAHPDHTRIVLDVDDPDEPGIEDAERTVRERRIVFYERLGVALTPVREYAPPHHGGPLPMRLMVADLRAEQTEALGDRDLRAVVVAVLRHRYDLDEDTPLVQSVLAASGLST
ncbi:GNAT family N-acetyltransferase [Nocardioides marmoraquaticus]